MVTTIVIIAVVVLVLIWVASLYNNMVRMRNNRENAFGMLSPSRRQVAYALLTRLPLASMIASYQIRPFDLHVLGAPPAFVLSQDQTLYK